MTAVLGVLAPPGVAALAPAAGAPLPAPAAAECICMPGDTVVACVGRCPEGTAAALMAGRVPPRVVSLADTAINVALPCLLLSESLTHLKGWLWTGSSQIGKPLLPRASKHAGGTGWSPSPPPTRRESLAKRSRDRRTLKRSGRLSIEFVVPGLSGGAASKPDLPRSLRPQRKAAFNFPTHDT